MDIFYDRDTSWAGKLKHEQGPALGDIRVALRTFPLQLHHANLALTPDFRSVFKIRFAIEYSANAIFRSPISA
jgi:hypothetical protein